MSILDLLQFLAWFFLYLPFVLSRHKRIGNLALQAEQQIFHAAVERRNSLTSPVSGEALTQTKKYFQKMTGSYMEVRNNQMIMSIAKWTTEP